MSLSEEERRAIVLYRIEKAKASLDDIHKVFYGELLPIGCIMRCIMQRRHY